MRSGANPSAPASRRRFSNTASRSSSVRMPRLRASKGGSLAPPRRVVKAAVASGILASSQRNPFPSRHSIAAPRHLKGDRQLLLAPRDLAVELAAQSLLESATERGTLTESRPDQVRPVDLQADVAPLAQVAVEPLGAEGASEDELGAVARGGQGHALRWTGGPRRGQGLLATGWAQRRGKQGAIA